ncbi:hypothetical protein ACIPY2_19780 [Paenarthrobacter sp. NPDC089675]
MSPPAVSRSVDRDVRGAAEASEDVELGSGDRGEDSDQDRDDDAPEPERQALFGPVEARHAPGGVSSAVVGDVSYPKDYEARRPILHMESFPVEVGANSRGKPKSTLSQQA